MPSLKQSSAKRKKEEHLSVLCLWQAEVAYQVIVPKLVIISAKQTQERMGLNRLRQTVSEQGDSLSNNGERGDSLESGLDSYIGRDRQRLD